MADAHDHDAGSAAPGDAHEHFHLPPNSWAPINVALALTMGFLGALSATWVWVVGLIWLLASLYAWFRGARSEYRDLPESLGEH